MNYDKLTIWGTPQKNHQPVFIHPGLDFLVPIKAGPQIIGGRHEKTGVVLQTMFGMGESKQSQHAK